jgi:hypothetical protein
MSTDTTPDPVTIPTTFGAGLTFAEGRDHVRRAGKIFECGDYPDKDFSLTEEEAAAAAAAFTPVPLDLEHLPTVLDNKLGRLVSVEARGKELYGTVEMPDWLDSLLDDDSRRVSATWDRATKTLRGLALVRTPRITDAALYSAFSEFAGRRHSAQDLADLQTIHDLVTGQGAVCAPRPAYYHTDNPPPISGKEELPTMNEDQQKNLAQHIADGISRFFGGGKPDAPTTPAAAAATPAPAPVAPTPAAPAGFSAAEFAALKEKADAFDALQAQFSAVKADADAYRAGAVEEAKKAHVRCFGREPEEPKLASFGAQSVADIAALAALWNETADAKFGIGRAADGGAQRESAPSPVAAYSADASGGQSADAEEARLARLLGTSELGRQAAARNANGK